MRVNSQNHKSCAVLYSGGTDSTAAAALMAGIYRSVHLLTFYQENPPEDRTINQTIRKLKKTFPDTKFLHTIIDVTKLVKYISYNRYFYYLWYYRWLVLSTPGFTALAWHVRAILYCRKHNIPVVADGLTRELMQFPGHMDRVIAVFRRLYASFGISYINPVRNWPVAPDRQFMERLLVDRHGYFFPVSRSEGQAKRTTGRYLYKLGIFPRLNMKGSRVDQLMQYDCYPFVVYNMMVFWMYLNRGSYEDLCIKMERLFAEKAKDARKLIMVYIPLAQV